MYSKLRPRERDISKPSLRERDLNSKLRPKERERDVCILRQREREI